MKIGLGLNIVRCLTGGARIPIPTELTNSDILFDAIDSSKFSDTSGTTPQTTLGNEIKAVTNLGTLGGLLSSTGFSSTRGPLLAQDSGSGYPLLDFRPSGAAAERVIGCGVSSGATGNLTIYTVFKCQLASGWGNGGFPWSLIGTSNATLDFPLFAASKTYDCTLGNGTENTGLAGNVNPFIDEGWHIGVFRRTATGGSNGTWDIWVDGAKTDTANVSGATTIARFNMGAGALGSGFNGLYAFASMARTVAHDQTTIDSVVAYLRDRFSGLFRRRRVCVCVGDSKTSLSTCNVSNADSTFAPDKFNMGIVARNLAASGLDALYTNSWPGKKITDHNNSTDLTRIAAWLSQATIKELVLMYCGVNDLWQDSATGAATFTRITDLITAIRARRPNAVFLVETPGDGDPATWGGTYSTRRSDLQTLITNASNQSTYGYTAGTIHMDPVGYPWGTPGRDSSYFVGGSDGLHCVGPGMEREGNVFVTDLGTML